MAKTVEIIEEYFNLKKLEYPNTTASINSGYIAGYIKKASTNSPLNSSTKALWIPQPRHSTPRYFLFKQGSI